MSPAISFRFFYVVLGLLGVVFTFSACRSPSEPIEAGRRSPIEVVNERMNAYNNHDLDAFLGTYAAEVELFTYPDSSLGQGKDHLRSIFEPMFEQGAVQVTVHHQIAKDSYVINHETVTEGETQTEYVSIYEVRGDLIRSVRFVRD